MAAAKRAEIERRLAALQIQREQEEALLDALSQQDAAETVDADFIRNQASAVAPASSLTIFGKPVHVGDRVSTTPDQQLLRKADTALPRRDTLKSLYLGEPGAVVALFPSYHGRPAIEIEFADRTRHIFFAECVAVGDAADRMTASKEVKGEPKAAAAASSEVARSGSPKASAKRADPHGMSPPVAPIRAVDARVRSTGAPSALPSALPRRPRVIPKANSDPVPFLAELQLLADADSDVSAAPVTPGPGRLAVKGHATKSATEPVRAAPAASSTAAAPAARVLSKVPSTARTTPAARTPSARTLMPAGSAAGAVAVPKRPETAGPASRRVEATPAATRPTTARTAPAPAAATTQRPVTLKVYENGSYGDMVNDRVPFRTVTVRPTFKAMAPVHSLVAQALQWGPMGRKVEVLYDASTGRPITSVADLSADTPVVASMGDSFVQPRPNSQLYSELPEAARGAFASAAKPRAQSPRAGHAPARATPSKAGAAPSDAPLRKSTASTVNRSVAVKPAARTPAKRATANSLLQQIEQLESRLETV